MRLYLSSFRCGSCPERLVELAGGATRTAVIANAADAASPSDRKEAVEGELARLAELGLEADELDLRSFFGVGGVEQALGRYGIVWVRGGDVFTLRHAMARSGADDALAGLVRRDLIVYGGYSAGTCVLAPSLRGLELVDDPATLQALHGVDPLWDGLGLLDYCIVPHVDTPEHPESPACNELRAHYLRLGTPFRDLRDGQVLIVDGEHTTICG